MKKDEVLLHRKPKFRHQRLETEWDWDSEVVYSILRKRGNFFEHFNLWYWQAMDVI